MIVPGAIVDHWRSLGKTQLIAELELLQILVFFQHYRSLCKNRRVLLFVDNNAIRDAIVKGTSKSLSVHRMWAEACLCWVSRVLIKSNLGDFPSRQKPKLAAEIIKGSSESSETRLPTVRFYL